MGGWQQGATTAVAEGGRNGREASAGRPLYVRKNGSKSWTFVVVVPGWRAARQVNVPRFVASRSGLVVEPWGAGLVDDSAFTRPFVFGRIWEGISLQPR